MRLLIDMDGCVVNILAGWLKMYNDEYGDELEPEDVRRYEMHKVVKPECGKNIYKYLLEPGFFRNAIPYKHARATLNALHLMKHELVFCTLVPPESPLATYEKWEWLKEHVFEMNKTEHTMITTPRKDLIKGDLLLDDRPDTLNGYPGRAVCMGRPYNWRMRKHE
jgi:5'(3')-deoxyribonucleotidase